VFEPQDHPPERDERQECDGAEDEGLRQPEPREKVRLGIGHDDVGVETGNGHGGPDPLPSVGVDGQPDGGAEPSRPAGGPQETEQVRYGGGGLGHPQEKAAVAHGGGTNHRIGLYDAIIVKDNHLVANSDPVDLAVRIASVRREHPGIKIEFEADRLDQVEVFLGLDGIDVILLDNMPNEQLASAVALRDRIRPAILLEASGGVNLRTIVGIAETGVDFISVGALTHSVRAIDLGLDLEAI
jgi:hypothetical protein